MAIILYRNTDAPAVVLEFVGAALGGPDIEVEILGTPLGGMRAAFGFSTAAGNLTLLDAERLMFWPSAEMIAALPTGNHTTLDVFRLVDGRREKIGASRIEVLGAGVYKGPTQIVSLGPVMQGPPGWTPLIAMVVAGERRLLAVLDWAGGNGEKPAHPVYVGPAGYTADINAATDWRAFAEAAAAASAYAAAQSASAAGTSASSAATSATNAAGSATAAGTSASGAGTSASNAAASATAAAGSATAAGGSATNAAGSAAAAGTSASGAGTSASNAAGSATAAAGSATAAGTSATNAAGSATAAGTSASGAGTSASNAAASATAAGTSATAAGTSATNAATSETNAAAAAAVADSAAMGNGAVSVALAMMDLRAKGVTTPPHVLIDFSLSAYHVRNAYGSLLTSGDFGKFIAAA